MGVVENHHHRKDPQVNRVRELTKGLIEWLDEIAP